jgi:succinyl-CoA synthetase beta subunit
MKIHEYQGKALLRDYDMPVPRGDVAASPLEARRVAESLGGARWAVKAQIHAGGRGKGAGIRLAASLQEVEDIATQLRSS